VLPYRIVIFHPDRGSLSMFDDANVSSLLLGQERMHHADILENNQPVMRIEKWFRLARAELLKNPTSAGFIFQLRMESSDHVIYKSARIGETLANIVIRSFDSKTLTGGTYEEALALQDVRRHWFHWRWNKLYA
jgi:hypothetical protein